MATPRKKQNLGDNSAAARAFASMKRDEANLRKLFLTPRLDAFIQADKIIDRLRLDHIKMREALLPPIIDSVAPFKDVFLATDHFHNVFAETSVSGVVGDMVHESWREQTGGLTNYSAQLDAVAKLSLGENFLHLAATEKIFAKIDFDFLKEEFDFPPPTIAAVERSLLDTTASYRALMESVPDLSRLVQMPSFVLPGATYNLYTAGHALKALDLVDEDLDEDIEEELTFVSVEYVDNLDIVDLLESVNPELVAPYVGAKEALSGNNPDRQRHVLASLRDLWNHLVRALAPQDEVIEWISQNFVEGDWDYNKRPSRRGKIRYISKDFNSEPLVDFVDASIKMSTYLHKLYNRVHELTPGLTDAQLLAIIYRTEAELSYLIRIAQITDGH